MDWGSYCTPDEHTGQYNAAMASPGKSESLKLKLAEWAPHLHCFA
jgi:hypothetical protein